MKTLFLIIFPLISQSLSAPSVVDDSKEILSNYIFGRSIDRILDQANPVKALMTDYPFYAYLGNCGGTIIADRWILTAAHCIHQYSDVVAVGSSERDQKKLVQVLRIYVHPQYFMLLPFLLVKDIALIELSKKLEFNKFVQPAKLPTNDFKISTEKKYVTIGRGCREFNPTAGMTDHLMSAKVSPPKYSTLPCFFCMEDALCTESVVCPGDSGSALLENNTIIGITSMTDLKNSYFTKVADNLEWIKAVTGL